MNKMLFVLEGYKNLVLATKAFDKAMVLHSENGHEVLAGYGMEQEIGEINLKGLQSLVHQSSDYVFFHLGYDLKNELEELESNNKDSIGFDPIYAFIPKLVVKLNRNGEFEFLKGDSKGIHDFKALLQENRPVDDPPKNILLKPTIDKAKYLQQLKKIKRDIQMGEIYELNFCQEFSCSSAKINPYRVYLNLVEIGNAPFSAFYKLDDRFLLCASPERFLRKSGSKVISEPIKGTAPRGRNEAEDEWHKTNLEKSKKDRAENVMIVDLVRNDLSHIAQSNSVKVDELCKVYTFDTVHQMISKISGEVDAAIDPVEIIKACFPMGSMTGAPKIRAMELIEKYENFRRGLYSGSVGLINPEGDFDLNVVIRSILYNDQKEIVAAYAGGAITALSDPEQEYEESILKAKAMQAALNDE